MIAYQSGVGGRQWWNADHQYVDVGSSSVGIGISVAELAEGRRRGGSGGASSTTSVGTGISVSLLAEGRQRGGSGGAFFGIGGASGGGSPSDRRLREKGGSPWTHQGPPAQRKSRTPSRTIHKPSAETKTHDGRRSRLRTAGGGEGKPALLVVSRTGYGAGGETSFTGRRHNHDGDLGLRGAGGGANGICSLARSFSHIKHIKHIGHIYQILHIAYVAFKIYIKHICYIYIYAHEHANSPCMLYMQHMNSIHIQHIQHIYFLLQQANRAELELKSMSTNICKTNTNYLKSLAPIKN